MAEDLIAIGQILKPFGIKGDVRVRSLSDVPGRFESLKQATLVAPSGRAMATAVTRVRPDRGAYVVGFEAFSTPEAAAEFRGGWVKIPRGDTPPLPEHQYYEFDLIGMTVMDDTGRTLGTLEDILETGSNPVFVVRADGREWLIPGTREVVASIEVERRLMRIIPLPGLLDDTDAL